MQMTLCYFQIMNRNCKPLDCLNDWCHAWGLTINFNKSKAMHFRTPSASETECLFLCRDSHFELVTQYTYLGVLFTEHLNFMLMSKIVAQSASRALGLLISKDKAFGGMPFECFAKCYMTQLFRIPLITVLHCGLLNLYSA